MTKENVLRKWRKDRSLTQEQAAAMFGTSAWMVSMLETGNRKPSFDLAIEIQKVTKGEIMPIDLS